MQLKSSEVWQNVHLGTMAIWATIMTISDQIDALLDCHQDGGKNRFCAVAIQVALGDAALQWHVNQAQRTMERIDQAKLRENSSKALLFGPLHTPRRTNLAGILYEAQAEARLYQGTPDDKTGKSVQRVVLEQCTQRRLEEYGLRICRKPLNTMVNQGIT